MNIRILLCDTFPGLLPDYIPSYEWMFMRLFGTVGESLRYEVFQCFEGKFPTTLETDGLYLITGCNLSVYDEIGWIRSLLRWIREADAARVNVVGICFGHQAVAQALGGRVEKAPQGWGTGIRESRIVDEAALPYYEDKTLRLLYNHHDQVVEMPPTATLMATSDFCHAEAMRIGTHILTFQGHPEYLPEYAVHLIENFADDEPGDVKERALKSIGETEHQGEDVARWILKYFKR